jgi:hypothetical protein
MSNDIKTDGEIKVELSVEQTRALDYLEDKTSKRILYGGQAGGGKSYLIALYCYYMCTTYKGVRGYIARDAGLKKIKESVMVTCFDVWDSLGVAYKFNDKDSFIMFPNGSKITLLDIFHYPADPNFNALGSTEYTFGCIEEGVTASRKACEILMSRTRYKHDIYPELSPKQLITCNPDEGWIKQEIIIPHFEGSLKSDTKFIPATLKSNPNRSFVKTYHDTLNSMSDAYDKARLMNGDWFAQPRTGGEFYRDFDEATNTIQADDFSDNYIKKDALHITFDFNTKPYMTLCIWQVEERNGKTTITQIDEICPEHPNNNTKSTCLKFSRRYRDHDSGLFVYGDPAGKHEDTRSEAGHNDFKIIMRELSHFKPRLRLMKKAPSIVMRGNFINDCFAGRVKNICIFIATNCVNSKTDYNFVKETSDGKKLKKKIRDPKTQVSFEQYGHTSDANDYFIIEFFKAQYNLYLKGGSSSNGFIPETKGNNKIY